MGTSKGKHSIKDLYNEINPVLIRVKESDKGVIYQSIVAMGFRARQINDFIKVEIQERMKDIITDGNELETNNFDQLQISKEFDLIPKPTFLAMKEMYEDKLHFTIPEEEEQQINKD